MATSGAQAGMSEDWTKFVTLNPPNEVRFRIMEEDPTKAGSTTGDPDPEKKRAVARIQIINKSKSAILFKVKTTNIKNYMVRPNSEVIPSEHSVSVKILTQQNISANTKALLNDRFLVQLTKLEQPPTKQLSAEEIAQLWDGVDKSKLVQYKLKVDLGQDVAEALQVVGAKAPGSGPDPAQAKSDLYQSVQAHVVDQLLDPRGKQEESKEKPDISRYPAKPGSLGGGRYGGPAAYGGMGPRMEDIKEQDSDQEAAQQSQYPGGATAAVASKQPQAAASVQVDAASLSRKIHDAHTKKLSLQSQLTRMKDSQSVLRLKEQALGSQGGPSSSSGGAVAKDNGYKLYHLMIAAILGLLFGAYTQASVSTPLPAQ